MRLSGQDSERGTFNQRHALLFDQLTGRRWVPTAMPKLRAASPVMTTTRKPMAAGVIAFLHVHKHAVLVISASDAGAL